MGFPHRWNVRGGEDGRNAYDRIIRYNIRRYIFINYKLILFFRGGGKVPVFYLFSSLRWLPCIISGEIKILKM